MFLIGEKLWHSAQKWSYLYWSSHFSVQLIVALYTYITLLPAGAGREEDKEHAELHDEVGGNRAGGRADNRSVLGWYREGGERDQREGGHDAGDRALQERLPAARGFSLRGSIGRQELRQQQPAGPARHAADSQSSYGEGHRFRRQDQEEGRPLRDLQQQ